MLSAVGIGVALGLDTNILLALIPKSATAPAIAAASPSAERAVPAAGSAALPT